MELNEQINKDFMEAFKAKDMAKKNFLGVLKGAISNNTEGGKTIPPTDENVIKVIKSLEKSINENITQRKSQVLDVSEQELELSYIAPYKPEELSEDELKTIIKEILGRDGIKLNIGFLMGTFNKENRGGKAFDNKLVMSIIEGELA